MPAWSKERFKVKNTHNYIPDSRGAIKKTERLGSALNRAASAGVGRWWGAGAARSCFRRNINVLPTGARLGPLATFAWNYYWGETVSGGGGECGVKLRYFVGNGSQLACKRRWDKCKWSWCRNWQRIYGIRTVGNRNKTSTRRSPQSPVHKSQSPQISLHAKLSPQNLGSQISVHRSQSPQNSVPANLSAQISVPKSQCENLSPSESQAS